MLASIHAASSFGRVTSRLPGVICLMKLILRLTLGGHLFAFAAVFSTWPSVVVRTVITKKKNNVGL